MNQDLDFFQWINTLATDTATTLKVVAGVVIMGLILLHCVRKQMAMGAIVMAMVVASLAYAVIVLDGYIPLAQMFSNVWR